MSLLMSRRLAMKRRFNYTDRKRITQDLINISLTKRKDLTLAFSALVELGNLELPKDAKVYIEAYHYTDSARYSYGTVINIQAPVDTGLSNLARPEDLRFRISVVDEATKKGLILASADKIRPTSTFEKQSILPVKLADLGRQVWMLDFNGDQPVLALNEKLPNVLNLPSTDPRFRLYILPVVLREVFSHMFFVDKLDDFDEPPLEWHRIWLEFAKRFIPHDSQWPEKFGDEYSSEDLNRWIDLLEREFCLTLGRDWQKLVSLEEVE